MQVPDIIVSAYLPAIARHPGLSIEIGKRCRERVLCRVDEPLSEIKRHPLFSAFLVLFEPLLTV
jgi:hypothetical protein